MSNLKICHGEDREIIDIPSTLYGEADEDGVHLVAIAPNSPELAEIVGGVVGFSVVDEDGDPCTPPVVFDYNQATKLWEFLGAMLENDKPLAAATPDVNVDEDNL